MRDLWQVVVMLVHVVLAERPRAALALPVTRNDGSRIWRTQISP